MSPLPWATAKDGGAYFMCSALPESWVATFDGTEEHELVLAAVNSLGALLDERDRLRAALTSILFLRPGGPCRNTLVEQMEIIARQALSQEIG